MQEFVMMCGVPGSGKSTYAKTHFGKTHCIVSTDAIRKELYGDESVQAHGNIVFSIARHRVIDALNRGENVVLDATFVHPADRARILENIQENMKPGEVTYKVVAMLTKIGKCMEQNRQRERVVPEDVILRMNRNFIAPTIHEGWDEVILVG